VELGGAAADIGVPCGAGGPRGTGRCPGTGMEAKQGVHCRVRGLRG